VVIHDSDAARRGIDSFKRYPKVLSWLVLHAAGVPALPGIVFQEWNAQVAGEVYRFAEQWGSGSLLVRSDSASESGLSPRGGYLAHGDGIERESRSLLAQGRAVFLLEPASPFDDLYSANFAPQAEWRDWWLEIVGAGFDASDLKRGDVTPHETVRGCVLSDRVSIMRREVADTATLRAARDIRTAKVARMLGCASSEVEARLSAQEETLLLDSPIYVPMPTTLIDTAIEAALRVRPALRAQGLSDRQVMLSLGFLTRAARLVFWDVVWPSAKYSRGQPEPPRQP
jgi:hypothetical protein